MISNTTKDGIIIGLLCVVVLGIFLLLRPVINHDWYLIKNRISTCCPCSDGRCGE